VNARRIGILALIAALAAALTIAAWLGPHRVNPNAATARLGLTLLVNRRAVVEMSPGTPLRFEASLVSASGVPPFSVGSRWKPWHQLIRLEAARVGETLPWPLPRPGPARTMEMIEGRPSITHEPAAVAHLVAGRQVHTVTFASSPEDTVNLPPGTYRIRGVFSTPFWQFWGWKGRAVSGEVRIVVVDAARAGGKRSDLEGQRLALALDFYLDASRFEEALRAATTLTDLRPSEARSHVLLGDVCAALNRRAEALRAYERAMALLPRTYEPPEMLLARIRQLKDGPK